MRGWLWWWLWWWMRRRMLLMDCRCPGLLVDHTVANLLTRDEGAKVRGVLVTEAELGAYLGVGG